MMSSIFGVRRGIAAFPCGGAALAAMDQEREAASGGSESGHVCPHSIEREIIHVALWHGRRAALLNLCELKCGNPRAPQKRSGPGRTERSTSVGLSVVRTLVRGRLEVRTEVRESESPAEAERSFPELGRETSLAGARPSIATFLGGPNSCEAGALPILLKAFSIAQEHQGAHSRARPRSSTPKVQHQADRPQRGDSAQSFRCAELRNCI